MFGGKKTTETMVELNRKEITESVLSSSQTLRKEGGTWHRSCTTRKNSKIYAIKLGY